MAVLIVGLGNPESKYDETRHNIGFHVIDKLAEALNIHFKESSGHSSSIGIGDYAGKKVILCKPLTYMNKSGDAVLKLIQFYKIESKDVWVVHDEADFADGVVRSKFGGGAAGHNGVHSIIDRLGTDAFYRIRIGIGKPEHGDLAHYVLQKGSPLMLDRVVATATKIREYIKTGIKVEPIAE